MSAVSSRAVFLSYASQDIDAARRICEALRAGGVEVWFDQNELVGGDVWDAKIRKQIRECALFVPIISANTQARREGYFRREWKQAAERTRDIADGTPFLLPAVIDATRDADTLVPEEFRAVQWTRLASDRASSALVEQVRALLVRNFEGGDAIAPRVSRKNAGPEPGSPRRNQTRSTAGRRMLGATGIAVVVGAVGLTYWLSVTPRSRSQPPAVGASQVQSLIAKAWEQLNSAEIYRTELQIADELCQRAATLDAMNPVIWATWSQVDTWLVYLGLDTSAQRRESARNKAARALTLDINSFEARLAEACYVVRAMSGRPGIVGFDSSVPLATAEQTLRELLRQRPKEPRALFALGILLRNSGKFDEGAATFDLMAEHAAFTVTALNEKAWLMWRAGRYPEAQTSVDRSIALQPLRGNLQMRITLALYWSGDLKLARTTLKQLPDSVLREDAGATLALRVYQFLREPEEMMRVLRAIPRPWLSHLDQPKLYCLAEAQRMAGDLASAHASLRDALRLVDDRLLKEPEVISVLLVKAQILAELGRTDEARSALQLARGLGYRQASFQAPISDVTVLLTLRDFDAAFAVLEQQFASTTWPLTWAGLNHDPKYDPLRDHPRFVALLERAARDPKRCPHAESAKDGTAQKSVAVLAFENRSSEKDSEYFSDGICEELLNVLAKVPGLRVVGRTSAFSFKGKNVTAPEIGRTLDVTHLVDGTVQRTGSRARIFAQLVRAQTGEVLWSDTFNTELKDIFAAQGDIAGRIAKQLSLTLGGPSRNTTTVNPEAHRRVLEGRYFLSLRDGGFTQAESAFRQALQIDPHFAAAHAGLAGVHVLRRIFRFDDDFPDFAADLRAGRQCAERAIDLDPGLVEAHAVLGYGSLLEGRLAESEQHFQRGLALNPNDAFTRHWRAHLLARMGRLDLALAENERAVRIDPLAFSMLFVYAKQLLYAGRPEHALEVIQRSLALRTNFLPSRGIEATALLAVGRHKEAAVAARAIRNDVTGSYRWWADIHAVRVLREASLGQEAAGYAADLLARAPAGSWKRSALFAVLGRFDDALAPAETMTADPFNALVYFWGPAWDAIRDDSRFLAKMTELGLKDDYNVARETLAQMQKAAKTNAPTAGASAASK